MTQTRTPSSVCLNCGKRIDGASSVKGNRIPSPGDISICAYCSHIMAFADDLTLRELNDEEARDIAGEPTLLRALEALNSFRKFCKWKEQRDAKEKKAP